MQHRTPYRPRDPRQRRIITSAAVRPYRRPPIDGGTLLTLASLTTLAIYLTLIATRA